MTSYLIRRLLLGVVTLMLITFVVFGLIRNMPGTPLTVELGESDPSRKINPEDLQRMMKTYGLDKPWYTAYFQWIGNVAQGDLGARSRASIRSRD